MTLIIDYIGKSHIKITHLELSKKGKNTFA